MKQKQDGARLRPDRGQSLMTRRQLLAGVGHTAILAPLLPACTSLAEGPWSDGTYWHDGLGWVD